MYQWERDLTLSSSGYSNRVIRWLTPIVPFKGNEGILKLHSPAVTSSCGFYTTPKKKKRKSRAARQWPIIFSRMDSRHNSKQASVNLTRAE